MPSAACSSSLSWEQEHPPRHKNQKSRGQPQSCLVALRWKKASLADTAVFPSRKDVSSPSSRAPHIPGRPSPKVVTSNVDSTTSTRIGKPRLRESAGNANQSAVQPTSASVLIAPLNSSGTSLLCLSQRPSSRKPADWALMRLASPGWLQRTGPQLRKAPPIPLPKPRSHHTCSLD